MRRRREEITLCLCVSVVNLYSLVKLTSMKTRYWLWGVGFAVVFVAGVVAVLSVLARHVQQLKRDMEQLTRNQKQTEVQIAELRADVEAANNELLIMRAEADLRIEQLRRLLEGERDEWDSSN